MSSPVIYARRSLGNPPEFDAASKFFEIHDSMLTIKPGSLVIPRYSILPYYDEVERDIKILGSSLINSYEQHRWIANFEYYEQLKDFTFKTWDESEFYLAPEGRYVVKGRTNSKKNQWNRCMFAENKKAAAIIGADLYEDSVIGSQGIIFREYEELDITEEESLINGQPLSKEWRFFFYKNRLISHSFYWSNTDIELPTPKKAMDFAQKIAEISLEFVNFFVVDVALRRDGSPVLVELNDASMSGLSNISPWHFYLKLKSTLASR